MLCYEQAYLQITRRLRGIGQVPRWDDASASPYFSYEEQGAARQMWFDDPRSLSAKLALVGELGLAGGGPYEFSDLDYGSEQARNETAAMWQTLRGMQARHEARPLARHN